MAGEWWEQGSLLRRAPGPNLEEQAGWGGSCGKELPSIGHDGLGHTHHGESARAALTVLPECRGGSGRDEPAYVRIQVLESLGSYVVY